MSTLICFALKEEVRRFGKSHAASVLKDAEFQRVAATNHHTVGKADIPAEATGRAKSGRSAIFGMV